MAENYYNILGVKETASKDEIKRAYRNLQMKYHPDKNNNSQESINMTQKLNEAYETLGDKSKKEYYDMSQKNPFFNMNTNGINAGFSPFEHSAMEVPIDELINAFLGGMPMRHSFNNMNDFNEMSTGQFGPKIRVFHGEPLGFQKALQKPTSIIKSINISIGQVLTGASLPLEIERWIIENNIKVFETETIYVDIPSGIDDGELIILRDKGNYVNDNCKGDIKVFVKVINDSAFKRNGLNLILEKNITLKEALCGFSFEIKYINGKSYTLNNNKGNIIPPEYKKVYNGMGLKRDNHKGDMIIHFHIDFPESLNEQQINKISEIL